MPRADKAVKSREDGDVYKRQAYNCTMMSPASKADAIHGFSERLQLPLKL